MIPPFIVIEDTNFHEDRSHVKLQRFLLTIVAFGKTHSSKIPPGTFCERQFYIFLTLFKLREN